MSYVVTSNLLTPNRYSRPQIALKPVKAIVIHYVANTNSSAKGNRDFFESRKSGTSGFGSAHEIIDIDGDIIVCIPDNEVAYNCGSSSYTQRCLKELGNNPNGCTYSIECTHIKDDGTMSTATYNTLVERCYDLCKRFKLNANNIWLHKEVVGWKPCHLWFVNNPNEWIKFKELVQKKLDNDKIVAATNIVQKEVAKVFNDIDTVSEYAKPSIIKLEEKGILKGDKDGNVNPKNAVTIEQLAVVIDRVLKLIESEIKK